MNQETTARKAQNKMKKERDANRRILTAVAVVFCGIFCVLAFFAWKGGLLTSADKLQAFLNRMGIWAPFVFFVMHVGQILLPIVPGGVVCAAGVLVFGPVWGYVLNYLDIVIGSTIAFFLARYYGMPIIKKFFPPKSYEKYIGWLEREQSKFNKLFALAIFIPLTPDDLICMLAGVSKMKVRTFMLILLLCKPLFLLPYSFYMPSVMAWFSSLL